MRVLHLTSGSLDSGAGKGALRLHLGLRDIGVKSFISAPTSDAGNVAGLIEIESTATRIKKGLNHRFNNALLGKKWNDEVLYSVGLDPFNVFKDIDFDSFDVINLHWINYGISVSQISQLIPKAKVLWTMRDMWPFTKGCHYSLDCNGYEQKCTACPLVNKRLSNYISNLAFERRKWLYSKVHFVAISEWLRGEALKTGLFSNSQISTIYNSVEKEVFKAKHRNVNYKRSLGLDAEMPVVLVGAQNLLDPHKGGRLLLSVIDHLKNECQFIFFGKGANEFVGDVGGLKSVNIGFVDELVLSKAFANSDLFLMLSSQEAFGKTIIESIFCGTPVVCLDSSAPGELISHLGSGAGFASSNVDDIVSAVRRISLGKYRVPGSVIEMAENQFSIQKIAQQYLKLYSEML